MNRLLFSLAVASAVLLPAGCERASAERATTLVAAKVNGAEISLHQVRGLASGAAGGASAAAGGTASGQGSGMRQALEKVIERELLVQQALQAGLERDPRIKESIDGARRQLLAQAWLDKIASGKTVTREEIRKFYADNPALFAERRIYRMRELRVAASPAMADVVRGEASRARDLDELAGWLREREARFTASSATLPAEQVPLGHLTQLSRMQAGEIAVFAVPASAGAAGGVAVVELVQAEPAPLSEPQAAPLIEQFLSGRKRLELAAAEVRRLREVATIEYAGEFKRSN